MNSGTYDLLINFGFNRYAYCAYNPLKYVDPSGELYFGWVNIEYMIEQEIKHKCREDQYRLYEIVTSAHELTMFMAGTLFSQGMDDFGNGSGNHGSPGGGGSVQNGSTGNGHGDGNPTNTSNSSANGKPGSSMDNPTNSDFLGDKCIIHFMFGNGEPYYVDARTIDFSYLSKSDLIYDKETNTYSINLFSESYLSLDNIQVAGALGSITLSYLGNNQYEIKPDYFDFDIRYSEGFSGRNIATFIGGSALGVIDNNPYRISAALFFGGPFYIIFTNTVYIKP